MNIPVFRHNVDLDDWEVASVYDSDDCGSLGGSAYGESVHSGCSLLDPALYSEGYTYDDGRPRFVNGYPVPQQQCQNYSPMAPVRPQWEAPGKPSTFVVPPPGVIFPPKDWAHPPQETYWPTTINQMASSSDMRAGVGLIESPPLPPLLLSPSSPPPAASALIKRPSPATTIVHGQSHGTSSTVPGPCTGATVGAHASPVMPPPPRYHEVVHAVPPRLADVGCQAHPGMATSPPRRSGHEVASSYATGPGHGTMSRGPRTSGELSAAEGRYGGPGASGHSSYGPGDRSDGHPPPVPSKYEYEEREQDGGRAWAVRPYTRERRPSIWQRFVRRFSPSHVSVGQT